MKDYIEYKKMYYTLFNKISNIVKELEEAQKETEEMFISIEEKEKVSDAENRILK